MHLKVVMALLSLLHHLLPQSFHLPLLHPDTSGAGLHSAECAFFLLELISSGGTKRQSCGISVSLYS